MEKCIIIFSLFETMLTSLMLANFIVLAICMHFVPMCNVYDTVIAEVGGLSF